jgi:hypothetical protein
MKRTPDDISKKRQELAGKIKKLRAGIAEARLDPTTEEARKGRIAFGEAEVAQLKKEILGIGRKAKRAFWPRGV